MAPVGINPPGPIAFHTPAFANSFIIVHGCLAIPTHMAVRSLVISLFESPPYCTLAKRLLQ